MEELQQLYDSSQRERSALEQELQRCKAELQKLVGGKSKVRGQRSKTGVHWGSRGVLISFMGPDFRTPETPLVFRNLINWLKCE